MFIFYDQSDMCKIVNRAKISLTAIEPSINVPHLVQKRLSPAH